MTARQTATCLPGLMLLLAGCEIDGFGPADRYSQEFHHSYPLQAGGRVSVENFNGSVEIAGWDQNTIDISGRKYAASPELRDAIRIDIDARENGVQVRTVRPSDRRGHLGVSYVIKVPRRVQLERIFSSNGAIRVDGIEGLARLRTTNGSVRVSNVKGNLEAQTSNGSVDVTGIEGSATLHSSNGRVKAEGVRGALTIETSNGGINAELVEPSAGRPVKLETSNGGIDLRLPSLAQNDIRAMTTNGGITLRLPTGLNAHVKANTSNSSISTDFEVRTQGALSKTRIDGTIGSGGPVLDLSTTNGPIRLQRM